MTTEEMNYKANLSAFVNKLENTFVHKMILSIDYEPTFDLDTIPFKFKYSFSVALVTENGSYKIFPSLTSAGFETFWIEQAEPAGNGKVQEINSTIKAICFETKKDFEYPFRMIIEFTNKELLLYCGEIYNDIDGEL